MEIPLHAIVVHFPLIITFILPVLILVFALMIRANRMNPVSWLVIVGLSMFVTGAGYFALETGETEEHRVKDIVAKKLVHEHEEAGEIFVGSTVLVLVVGIAAFFIRRENQFQLQIAVLALSLLSSYFAYQSGKLGGELVYAHGAAAAYKVNAEAEPMGILPTPGQNTSESPFPVDEGE
jgi:uncharacterized membrane protein